MAYLMAIEGEPADCVEIAVRRFIRGDVERGNHRFLPSTAELAREVRRLKDERAAERFRLAIAPPKSDKPADPEARAKVAALMEGLAKRIPEAKERRRGAMADDDLEILKGQPVRVSAALLDRLKAQGERG
jgi:hypothetical protein